MEAYAIQDFDNRTLRVVYETTERQDARKVFERFKNGSCELYADVDGRTYRIICEQTMVKSEPKL